MKRPSLARRLLLSSLLGLALLLPLGGLALSWGFRHSAEAAFDARLDAWSQAVAAQFESFRDPLIILVTVPLSVAGALLGLALFGRRSTCSARSA